MDKEKNEAEHPMSEAASNTAENLQAEVSTSYKEAMDVSDVSGSDEDTYLGYEDTVVGGGNRFIPNYDPEKPVVIYSSIKPEGAIIRIGRSGKGEKEGGFIPSFNVESNFKYRFHKAEHKTQAVLKLPNGKALTGYIVKGKSRRGIYLPKKLVEDIITLPVNGKVLLIKAQKLVIG